MTENCSMCNHEINAKQADYTFKVYGKYFCPDPRCLEAAKKEADAATDAAQPPEIKIFNDLGWKFGKGAATKDIDGKEVMVVYADLAKKGGACLVAGKPYMPGNDSGIDRELKVLFDTIGGKPEKNPPKPRHEQKAPAVVVPVNSVLSVESILKYIAPDATEEEAFMFLQLCIARKLNPFLKEAYLIKYSKTSPASFVVGKDAFTKRADAQPDFRGFKAGLILKEESGTLVRREGTFLQTGETLLGGWAKVIRKDHEDFSEEVALSEYIRMKDGRPSGNWATMPGTMIRKVALVHAIREAYPQEFAGMYAKEEIQEVSE